MIPRALQQSVGIRSRVILIAHINRSIFSQFCLVKGGDGVGKRRQVVFISPFRSQRLVEPEVGCQRAAVFGRDDGRAVVQRRVAQGLAALVVNYNI